MFFFCVSLFVKCWIFYKSHLWESDGFVLSVLVWISWVLLSKLEPHIFSTGSPCILPASLQGCCKPGFTILGEHSGRGLLHQMKATLSLGTPPNTCIPKFCKKTLNKPLILKLFYLYWYAQRRITLSSLLKVSISFFALSLCTACLVVTCKLL